MKRSAAVLLAATIAVAACADSPTDVETGELQSHEMHQAGAHRHETTASSRQPEARS